MASIQRLRSRALWCAVVLTLTLSACAGKSDDAAPEIEVPGSPITAAPLDPMEATAQNLSEVDSTLSQIEKDLVAADKAAATAEGDLTK